MAALAAAIAALGRGDYPAAERLAAAAMAEDADSAVPVRVCRLAVLGRAGVACGVSDPFAAAGVGRAAEETDLAADLIAVERFAEGWALQGALSLAGRLEGEVTDVLIPHLLAQGARRWTGEPPAASDRLCVVAEQGWGDMIQMVRYVARLPELFDKPAFVCPIPLMPLLRAQPWAAGVRLLSRPQAAAERFDWAAMLFGLPYALRDRVIDPAPPGGAYLQAASFPAPALASLPASVRVGIAWRGSSRWPARNLPLPALAGAVAAAGIPAVALHHDVTADEAALLDRVGIRHLAGLDAGYAFTDTAPLMARLDLVIAPDTSLAHLAGALGRPAWVLLPRESSWRWGCEPDRCRWYPSATLFRQARAGDWDAVVDRVGTALRQAVIRAATPLPPAPPGRPPGPGG